MSVLKYFKNTPGRPPIGRQPLSVIFFFKFVTRSLAKKKGACRPPLGRQAPICRHSLLSFEPKNSEKKRGEEKKSSEALQNSALVIYR